MIIHVLNQQQVLALSEKATRQIVQEVIAFEGQTCDEVTVNFVDSNTISKLHLDFFDDPTTTDCISFPMDEEEDEPYRILGEVFICPQTAIDYAAKNEGNPFQETTLYIIHSLLHLMGYDDVSEDDITEMRQAEELHMQHLKALGITLA